MQASRPAACFYIDVADAEAASGHEPGQIAPHPARQVNSLDRLAPRRPEQTIGMTHVESRAAPSEVSVRGGARTSATLRAAAVRRPNRAATTGRRDAESARPNNDRRPRSRSRISPRAAAMPAESAVLVPAGASSRNSRSAGSPPSSTASVSSVSGDEPSSTQRISYGSASRSSSARSRGTCSRSCLAAITLGNDDGIVDHRRILADERQSCSAGSMARAAKCAKTSLPVLEFRLAFGSSLRVDGSLCRKLKLELQQLQQKRARWAELAADRAL